MLARLRNEDLKKWKKKTRRKPLLLDGARQVGKTYLVGEIFGKKRFRKVHRLDFRLDSRLSRLFIESLDPQTILSNIELHLNAKISLRRDLIFFDEIGECQRAVDSLKYFAEELPRAYICASGSNIGLLESFPVGAVHHMELFPLCFEEFLMAKNNPLLLESFRERRNSQIVFDHLWTTLLDYYFVGGMPEAVMRWHTGTGRLSDRVNDVSQIHRGLMLGYRQDFGKYSGKIHALHIDAVFSAVPRQLASCRDESVKRFKFKGVIQRKNRYRDLRGPIDWLEKAKLIRKCHPINSKPVPPLQALIRDNMFKLYFFDVGLLNHMLEIPYDLQRSQSLPFKGYIAENFVQTELAVHSNYPTYSWQKARAEIEFLHQCKDGEIIPVEVKSGSRTRAKSLTSYLDRYDPTRAVMLAGMPAGKKSAKVQHWPLYEAQFLIQL